MLVINLCNSNQKPPKQDRSFPIIPDNLMQPDRKPEQSPLGQDMCSSKFLIMCVLIMVLSTALLIFEVVQHDKSVKELEAMVQEVQYVSEHKLLQ